MSIFQTIFKYKEKKSPDKLGYYPERVHISAMPERRYLWTSRILVILSCLSISLSMMLCSTIYLLLPQKGASPRLLQTNSYLSQLELTQRQEITMPVQNLIAEQYIEEYIMLRHVISNDYDELLYRWSPGAELYWLSSQQVFGSFASKDVQNNIMQLRMLGITTLVEIDWIKPVANGLWTAQFKTIEYYENGKAPSKKLWRVYMRVAFTNIRFNNKEQRVLNPFGFIMLNYSIAYAGNPNDITSYLETASEINKQSYNF